MLRIKLLRLSASLSQWHIAKASSMSQGRYSMIERGLIEPTPDERTRLAKLFRAAPTTLFRLAFKSRASLEQVESAAVD